MDEWLAVWDGLAAGARGRVERLSSLGTDWQSFVAGVAASGRDIPQLALSVALVVGVALVVWRVAPRALAGRGMSRLTLSITLFLCSLAVAIGAAFMLGGGPGPVRRALLTFAFSTPAALLMRALIQTIILDGRPTEKSPSLHAFVALISGALACGVIGGAVGRLLSLFGAGPGMRDLIMTLFVAVPVVIAAIAAYVRSGRAVAYELARGWGDARGLRLLARRWPAIAVAIIVLAFLVQQISITVMTPLPGLSFLMTLGAALLWPHLDAALARWAAAGLAKARVAVSFVAVRRTARPALMIAIAVAMIGVWGRPVVAATGLDVGDFGRSALGVAAILLFSAFLWNLIGAAVDRIMVEDGGAAAISGEDAPPQAPRSRLGTLLPLVGGTARIAIAALSALTVLLAIGVNVWPLVTGLSVFGLAIGFGSQTLVKDVVSGVFFLADDAFRLGEYIESSGAKGTVEKISVRSVSLRHPRGALATIPYGQIGKIQNFSRDWVIEKLAFRVAFDTDIQLVKKLFKEIGKEIAADPELASNLLEPFKSQGIGSVEDNTIILRGKFKAKAGQQFAIRKAVLARVQKAFQEHGIKTAPKPLPAQ
jgi:small-conductance mechanosensitive channel